MFGFFRKRACQRIRGELSEYLDGQLAPEELKAIEHHIESCPECRQELDSLNATVHLLHRVAVRPVPRSFVIAEVQPRPAPVLRPGWLRLGTAAAVVVLACLLISDAAGGLGPGLVGPETPPAVSNNTLLRGNGESTVTETQYSSADSEEEQISASLAAGEVVSTGGAGTWLGALEIGFSALVVILGGLTALTIWRKRRGLRRA